VNRLEGSLRCPIAHSRADENRFLAAASPLSHTRLGQILAIESTCVDFSSANSLTGIEIAENFHIPFSAERMRDVTKANQVKGEVVIPTEIKKRAIEAQQLDREIRSQWKSAEQSITKVAKLLNKMRESQFWQHLSGRHYRSFHEYVESVTGAELSRSRMFELLAAHGLTEGENPVPAKDVDKLGIKKAAQLARLEPNQRTAEIVRKAVNSSLREVTRAVEEKINETLLPEEQCEPTILFARNYPATVVARFEDLEERAIWMEGIRDGDTALSLRAKFMVALVANFEANFAEELKEADKYGEAMEVKRGKARIAESATEDDEDGPPEPREIKELAAAER
jgi:hypothetical protein